MKTCARCKRTKGLSEFPADNARRDKKNPYCKECHKEYRNKNRERIREYLNNYSTTNKEVRKEYKKKYYQINKERIDTKSKRWRANNEQRHRENCRNVARKIRSTLKGRLISNIRCGIARSLKGCKGRRHWEDLVGYNIDSLKTHLERHFLSGMTWDNMGEWHIDHKIPITAFNFEKPEDIDFKRCWALKNLRPMWAADNIRKSNKIDKPFQPALKIAIGE
jgi:hypothetical protein